MSARFGVALVLSVAAGWVGAAPSPALERGVFLDPGSPAGKEYTIPLSALRGQASGHAAVRDQPEPLFGVGITPAGAVQAGAGSVRSASSGGGHPGSTRPPARAVGAAHVAGASSTRASRAPGAVLAGATGNGSSAPALALISAAVVLGGLGLGALIVAVRRRLE